MPGQQIPPLAANLSCAVSSGEEVGVDSHAGDAIYVDGGERIDLFLRADASGYDELPLRQGTQPCRNLDGKALHQAFAIDVGVEVSACVWFESLDGLVWSEIDLRLPAFDGDFSVAGVNAGDYLGRAYGSSEFLREGGVDAADSVLFREERAADNDALGSSGQDGLGACNSANATAYLAGETLADLLDERCIVTLAHGRVEVDELD